MNRQCTPWSVLIRTEISISTFFTGYFNENDKKVEIIRTEIPDPNPDNR